MTINTGQLEINILKKLNASANTSDIQALATAKEFLKSSEIVVVEKYSDLPVVTSVPAGSLYFVEFDEMLYIPAQNYFGEIVWRELYGSDYNLIWGSGTNGTAGRLGNGLTTNVSSPVSVIGGFSDWCQVSVGFVQTSAVRKNGTLWSWGCNARGELGDGTVTNRLSPVSVLGGFTDWCYVAAGAYGTSAVRQNGSLWAWGRGNEGQLGDGTTVSKSSPIPVAGGFLDWCQTAVGTCNIAAVRQNGSLWTWGTGALGVLGDGTTTAKSSPVSVIGGFCDWCQVSIGLRHMAAVRQNGTLWTWGCAANGILGTNTTVSRSSPVSIVGGCTDWCWVEAACGHNVAIRTNGTLWAWGGNTCGLLGDGTTTNRSSPVAVVGGFTDWCQISSGSASSAAIRTNGTVWSWGCGSNGRLGNGTTVNRCSPTSLAGGLTEWCQVSARGENIMAIRRKVY